MQNTVLSRVVDRSLAGRRDAYARDVERLVAAGLGVMRRTGEIDPPVRHIVTEAGLSNQAFYKHFRSKDELLLAILAGGRRDLVTYLERRMAAAAGPAGRVRAWVEGVLAQARNPKAAEATRPFAVNAARLAAEFPAEVAASASVLQAPLSAALGEAGSGDPDRDAEAIYVLAMGTMERHLVARTRPSDVEVAHLVEFATRGAGVRHDG